MDHETRERMESNEFKFRCAVNMLRKIREKEQQNATFQNETENQGDTSGER